MEPCTQVRAIQVSHKPTSVCQFKQKLKAHYLELRIQYSLGDVSCCGLPE